MTTPLRQPRRTSRDPAPASAGRRTPSQSGIPMAASRSGANRQGSAQPSYDQVLGGGGGSTPPKATRGPRRAVSKADLGNEDLRAQIRTLQYELDALQQDAEVTRLRHEKEVRDAQAKAEAGHKRPQASERSAGATSQDYAALQQSLQEQQDAAASKQHDLEKRLRAAQDETRGLRDEAEEARSELSSQSRQHAHKLQAIEAKAAAAERAAADARDQFGGKEAELQRAAGLLAQKEEEAGELESALLRARAQAGGAEELATVRRELDEQVAHLRRLERTNSDQAQELRRLREDRRAVGVVEEEKRALELRLERVPELERELDEARFQRQRLDDERAAWAAWLGEADDFDSPAAVAKALAQERGERAAVAERLGAAQAESAEQEALIQALEGERSQLKAKLDKAKGAGAGTTDRARARTERQKALAVKEAEYLRTQLRTFEQDDTLDADAAGTKADEALRARVTELEDLVAQYRTELDAAAAAATELPPAAPPQAAEKSALKRGRDDEDAESEQLGKLSRKNRKLADEVSAATQRAGLLAAELEAAAAQVASLQAAARTRVLALRSNPTADFAAVKLSAIRTLRTENEGLHALLERRGLGAEVPRASLAAKEMELEEERERGREREKRMLRLKQSWAAKSNELRGAVASILGWNIVPAANGKFKLSSTLHPGDDDDDDDEGGGVGSNHLVFDAEKGEMLVGGGPQGDFGREIKPLIKFWVEGRKEIPGLMAACTLEFYERTTRAQRM